MKPIRLPLLFLLLCVASGAGAQRLSTHPYLCDSMVLQCGKPLPVGGRARPGAAVEVSFAGHTVAARADAQGEWCATLPALEPCDRNRTMEIRCGDERLLLRDVLVGEVWLAGGQSNMAFKVRGMSFDERLALIREADCSAVRCYSRAHVVSGGKVLDASDRPWSGAYGRRIYDWSAVAYLFARELHRTLGVPVGIVSCSHGGSTAEAWIASETFARDSALAASVGRIYGGIDSLYKNPSVLHDAMLARLQGLVVRGVIWYQGESNGYFPERYATMFAGLIADWRRFFGDAELPFLFAQLPAYRVPGDRSGERWSWLRQAQLDVARTTPHTALIVTADCGDANDIHPRNKYPVAMRFAAAAKRCVYGGGEPGTLTLPGPVAVVGRTVAVPVGGIRRGLSLRGGASGFELRDAGGCWHRADVRIRGRRLEVTAGGVEAPSGVRYAWGNVDTLTVYHRSGLPLPPFHFDVPSEKTDR